MRNVIDLRRSLGSVPIEDIRLDATSWDDIPALPVGLQTIYTNEATRTELFRLLDERILPGRRDTDWPPDPELASSRFKNTPEGPCSPLSA